MMRRSIRWVFIGLLTLAASFGLAWVLAKYRASPAPGGEAIKLEFIASPTVLVLNSKTGEVINQWGAKTFVMPHGLTIDNEDNIWLTDVGLQQVFKFDHEGNCS